MAPPALTAPDAPVAARAATAADAAARERFSANLRALGKSQPDLARHTGALPSPAVPVFGRDGSLTAFDEAGRWWSGCSLPVRAAREVLKTLDVRGQVACFLAPPHAGHVRVALESLRPWQAVIAVVPDERDLRVMLQCEDFSAPVAAGRLWFAAGGAWAARLQELLHNEPGLPTPGQFIRLPGADAQKIEPLITAAQKLFPEVLARRAGEIAALRSAWRPTPEKAGRICVLAPSHFELWQDAPFTLHTTLHESAPPGITLTPVRSDEPASASPLAVARAGAGCGAMVTADTGRADAPDLLPADMPWITWVTKPSVPTYQPAAGRDALLLADPAWRDAALRAGWPAGRVGIAAWPRVSPGHAREPEAPPFAALIADTVPLDPPARLKDFSSHLLLWNTLREELDHDPLPRAHAPEDFLDARMRRYGVSTEGFERHLFIDALLVPGFTQGVARTLLAAGLPLRLFGRGWAEVAGFGDCAAGPVADRDSLRGIVESATVLVHAWPSPHAHPLDACGRPVVRYRGGGAAALVAATRAALKSSPSAGTGDDALSAGKVLKLIR